MKKVLFGSSILILIIVVFLVFPKPSVEEVESKDATTEKYVILKKSLIAEHNKSDDCWLFIDDSVYNVTNFLQNHSGGPDKILPYCGGDATGAFKSRIHSVGAKILLKRLNLGKLNEKVSVDRINEVKKDSLNNPSEDSN